MPNLKIVEEFLTVEEVARLLRLRPSTIYAAVNRGQLPHVRLWKGHRRALIRFRRADIEAFLHERTVGQAK